MENIQDACVVNAASPGGPYDWHSIDWKLVQRFAGKAQMRIAQAELDKDFRRVKRLKGVWSDPGSPRHWLSGELPRTGGSERVASIANSGTRRKRNGARFVD